MSVVVVLQNAQLEVVKKAGRVSKKVLLSSETAPEKIRERSLKLKEARPDIVHQCLLSLLDSPLNKSGSLRVYVQTTSNMIIEVNSRTRIPRAFPRFSGLIVQLFERRKIKAAGEKSEVLLKLVRGPMSAHFSADAVKIGLSQDGKRLHAETPPLLDAPNLEEGRDLVFFINAVSEGQDVFSEVDMVMSVSSYPLSAATCCSRLCHEIERALSIF